jgi:hypothetical protein
MVHDSIAQLVELSARIGKNLDLVQAGGEIRQLKTTALSGLKPPAGSGRFRSGAVPSPDGVPPGTASPARTESAKENRFRVELADGRVGNFSAALSHR